MEGSCSGPHKEVDCQRSPCLRFQHCPTCLFLCVFVLACAAINRVREKRIVGRRRRRRRSAWITGRDAAYMRKQGERLAHANTNTLHTTHSTQHTTQHTLHSTQTHTDTHKHTQTQHTPHNTHTTHTRTHHSTRTHRQAHYLVHHTRG